MKNIRRIRQNAQPSTGEIRRLVKEALNEDLGRRGDVTSRATIDARSHSRVRLIAKENGIVCGVKVAMEAFKQMDRSARIKVLARDGAWVRRGRAVLEVNGRTRAILAAERVALNFIQRLSGIATLTGEFVRKAQAANSKSRILDTRKTTPLLRALEKFAVRCGGGNNHRFGLHDMVLIKDNHIAALSTSERHPLPEAVRRAQEMWPTLVIEVECDTLAQVREAAGSGACIILLDNMTTGQLRRAVRIVDGEAKTEASGGVNLKTVAAIARTGVDFISVGALTHSAPAMDFSLEIVHGRGR